jgi:hypothetical protein
MREVEEQASNAISIGPGTLLGPITYPIVLVSALLLVERPTIDEAAIRLVTSTVTSTPQQSNKLDLKE